MNKGKTIKRDSLFHPEEEELSANSFLESNKVIIL